MRRIICTLLRMDVVAMPEDMKERAGEEDEVRQGACEMVTVSLQHKG
jgi:hypothetical protein